MPKQIITDTFETLGGIVKQTGQQVVADTKKASEDVAIELGLKSPPKKQDDQTKVGQQDEQIKKMEQASKKRSISRYEELQAQIKALQEKRKKEIPEQVSGKPGFSEEKAVKQIEEKKEEKKKLPPLPVRRESQKAERFRGISG